MTDDRSLERAARSWIEMGPTRAPDRAVDAALSRIQSTRQERGPLIPWRLSNMNAITLRVAGLATVVVLLIAGGALIRQGFSTGPGSSQPPSPPPASSPSPSATAPATACGLITAAEAEQLAGIVGLGALPTESGSGAETTCIYRDGGGNIVLRLTYTTADAQGVFDDAQAAAGAQPAEGIGDAAVFDPATATLYIRGGDAVVAIVAGSSNQSAATRLGIERSIGALLVGRL